MENTSEQLLSLSLSETSQLASDIIFGQLRVVIATMPIEEDNATGTAGAGSPSETEA